MTRDSMVVSFAGIAGDHKGSPLQMRRNIVRCDRLAKSFVYRYMFNFPFFEYAANPALCGI